MKSFFVDLPDTETRRQIFTIHIARRSQSSERFDLDILVDATEGFSGAEIEQAIVEAMFEAFSEDREVETTDVMCSIEDTVPLSRLMKDEINELRTWSKSRARLASELEQEKETKIDIEI